jgi:hypothetical protein
MTLPKPIADLVDTLGKSDNMVFADSFSEDAVVFNDGKTYRGKKEITRWNEQAHANHIQRADPIEISTMNGRTVLLIRISGLFEGSPLTRKYNFGISENKITSLIIECV